MYTHKHTYTNVDILHTHMHVYAQTHVYECVSIYMYMGPMQQDSAVCIDMNIRHPHIHIYTQTHTQMHTRICTYAFMYTYMGLARQDCEVCVDMYICNTPLSRTHTHTHTHRYVHAYVYIHMYKTVLDTKLPRKEDAMASSTTSRWTQTYIENMNRQKHSEEKCVYEGVPHSNTAGTRRQIAARRGCHGSQAHLWVYVYTLIYSTHTHT